LDYLTTHTIAHGRWFSQGTPASSTTKTGCHDIAEILLKVALNTKKSNQIKSDKMFKCFMVILSLICIKLTKAGISIIIGGYKTS